MVSLVFVIGTLNIALGFALALALEHRLVLYVPVWTRDRSLPGATLAPRTPTSERVELPAQGVESVSADSLRDSDRKPRPAAGGPALADEMLGTLQRDVHLHVDTLRQLEDQIRGLLADPDPATVRACAEQLAAAGEEWLTRQCAVVRTMADTRERWGPHVDVERRLERMLLDQSPAIETSCRALAAIDPLEDAQAATRLVREVIRLVRDAHQLRDGVQEAYASLALRGVLAEPLDLPAHADRLTGLPDRVGLALLCRAWSRTADGHSEPRPIALVDVDDFGRANELLGTRAADQLLQAVADLLQREFAQGAAQVGRFGGQQYLVLWQAGESQAAGRQLERLLTFVAETPFPCVGQEYRLSLRSGLTELHPSEDVAEVFRRLSGLTELARQAGPHRLSVDRQGDHPVTGVASPAPAAHALPDPVSSAVP
ncbi:MAG: diguanylate cyclase [Pirellulaceae bacterium]|nr:diguanylate cyclase [Pirellulaceae bacterium]